MKNATQLEQDLQDARTVSGEQQVKITQLERDLAKSQAEKALLVTQMEIQATRIDELEVFCVLMSVMVFGHLCTLAGKDEAWECKCWASCRHPCN